MSFDLVVPPALPGPLSDIDEMAEWLIDHVHHVDHLRRRKGVRGWTLRVWVRKWSEDYSGVTFAGDTIEAVLGAAVEHVIEQRRSQREAAYIPAP